MRCDEQGNGLRFPFVGRQAWTLYSVPSFRPLGSWTWPAIHYSLCLILFFSSSVVDVGFYGPVIGSQISHSTRVLYSNHLLLVALSLCPCLCLAPHCILRLSILF